VSEPTPADRDPAAATSPPGVPPAEGTTPAGSTDLVEPAIAADLEPIMTSAGPLPPPGIPIAAAVPLILREVVLPRQERT
jgi:hypothetical protein